MIKKPKTKITKTKSSSSSKPEVKYEGFVVLREGDLVDDFGSPEVFNTIEGAIKEAEMFAEENGENETEYRICGLVCVKSGMSRAKYEIEW